LVVEPDAPFDSVKGVVDGLVAVEEVSPRGVAGVVDEWNGDCFVEEQVVGGGCVGIAPVVGIEGVGDEEQCP